MVYRGKPSPGCEQCRKAKKRCDLEQPSCTRCVKLKKPCTGYRDITQLQIQDESEAVRRKAERHLNKHGSSRQDSGLLAPPDTSMTAVSSPKGIPTPFSMNSDSSSSSDDAFDVDLDMAEGPPTEQTTLALHGPASKGFNLGASFLLSMSGKIRPRPNEIASNYFFYQFTSPGQWEYIRDIARSNQLDPCLDLAIQACGMAALTNVEMVPAGKYYAQANYGEALGLLNEALRDPKRSRSDETLIAVSMLGYYENILCDSHQSLKSWKAHIQGATQLLKLRGKAQFRTHVGRALFRELRAQIMIACLWDDREAPAFLEEFQSELAAQTPDYFHSLWKIADDLTLLYFTFAKLRRLLFAHRISDQQGLQDAAELERDCIKWSVDAVGKSDFWKYHEVEVDESEHVWNGKVHAFAGMPAPTMWNQWRIIRIMLSRTQELLVRRLAVSEDAVTDQRAYFRSTRRQMTDDICKTIPACLGHASPAFNSSCVLITAYTSIWALFFAGTTLVERVGPDAQNILYDLPVSSNKLPTAAYAQMAWVMGRMRYIANDVGIKWADGIAAILRGEVRMEESQDGDE